MIFFKNNIIRKKKFYKNKNIKRCKKLRKVFKKNSISFTKSKIILKLRNTIYPFLRLKIKSIFLPFKKTHNHLPMINQYNLHPTQPEILKIKLLRGSILKDWAITRKIWNQIIPVDNQINLLMTKY